MAKRFFRKWLLRPLLSLVLFSAVMALGELVFRHVEGYEVLVGPLRRVTPWVDEQPLPVRWSDEFLASAPEATDQSWFFSSPQELPRRAPDAALTARWIKGAGRNWVNYIINDAALLAMKERPRVAEVVLEPPRPDTVFVAPGPGGTPYPVYRYLPSAVYPMGLRTNRFGFRGRELSLVKSDRTIRIACLGASTTVGGHDLPFSYPELLQHWLELWGRKHWPGLNFEVINAGREGVSPRDLEAILRYELLPFEIDVLLYYEGWNHLIPANLVEVDTTSSVARPPVAAPLDTSGFRSLLFEKIRSLLRPKVMLEEAPRPPQRVPGLSEDSQRVVDPVLLDQTMRWMDVEPALNGIEQICRASGITLLVCTYASLVHEGLLLNASTHEGAYRWLNQLLWPVSYRNLDRVLSLQNEKFRSWCESHRVTLVDVASRTPKWPELYRDGIHGTGAGLRVRAWAVLEGLLPELQAALLSGKFPRADGRPSDTSHPYLGKHFEVETPPFK